jgi:hypothetical protein
VLVALVTLALVGLAVLVAHRAARSAETAGQIVRTLDVGRWRERSDGLRAAVGDLRDIVDHRQPR